MLFHLSVIRFSKNELRAELSKLNRKIGRVGKFFLLRKEVIHPHVPVGIPCYDLALITGSTLGLAHKEQGLRVFPAFLT